MPETKASERVKSVCVILLAFAIPFFIMVAIYATYGMAPWGEKSILIMDMSGQYVTFFAELRRILAEGGSLFFSWHKALGSNFIGLFAYYLASPFSFLILFFPEEQLPQALMWLTCLKIGLAGFSFALFLKLAFGKKNWAILLSACCYALMSYSCVYSLSVMWLDGLIFLPMILLGIERLLKLDLEQAQPPRAGRVYAAVRRFPWLLTAFLAVMFMANYYIAYMVGIFSALYFLLRFFAQRDPRLFFKYFWRFGAAALLAACLAGWLLVPTAKDLLSGKLAEGRYVRDSGTYFGLLELLKKLLPQQYDTIGETGGLPSIYCGVFALLGVGLFFAARRISKKEKLISLGIIAFMLVSFMFKGLDYVWHGFAYPVWFPFRNAFLLSAFLVYTAYRGILAAPAPGWAARKGGRICAGVMAGAVIAVQCLGLYENGKAMIAGLDREFVYGSQESYDLFCAELKPLVERAQQDEGFYRIEKTFERSKNDALTFGYNGVTHYSSTYNERVNKFVGKVGLSQRYHRNTYYGSTPVTDSLFAVKYIMSRGDMPDFYEEVARSGETVLYKNPFALPVGFMVQGADANETGFAVQNLLLSSFSGMEAEYFVPGQVTGKPGAYTITPVRDGPCYMWIPEAPYGVGEVYLDGQFMGNYFTEETHGTLYLGELEAGRAYVLEIRASDLEFSQPEVCTLDTESMRKALSALGEGGLRDETYGAEYIAGTVDAGQGGLFFTSIPYDAGFRVWVDGREVSALAGLETFLCFEVPEGTHEIRIEYTAPGARTGAALTVFGAAICLLAGGVYVVGQSRERKRKKTGQ